MLSFAIPALFLALSAYIVIGFIRSLRTRKHRRAYVEPLEQAVRLALRTKLHLHANIPQGLVRADDELARGTITLPPFWPGNEGDREVLLNAVRAKLGSEMICAQWRLEGRAPYMELYIPVQPPARVTFEQAVERFDTVAPYLGESAQGSINWDLSDDSPHVALLGGGGSGKSELLAWIVAQFMRGGAGVVVFDPKYSSHKWLMQEPRVLYCTEAAMCHSTIMWLDEELRRRGRLSQRSDVMEKKIIVVLEERNSLQSLLRDYWKSIRVSPAPIMSPALAALDRLASQGRALNINIILAAQEGAKVDVGSRNNFGAFALAGRLPQTTWRLWLGSGSKKPPISIKPGRFGWCVGGTATVFQAAFVDAKNCGARLLEWATSGDEILDVAAVMQQVETPSFPSSEPVTADSSADFPIGLRKFADENEVTLGWLRSQRDRNPDFPESVGSGQRNESLYVEKHLLDFLRVYREEREEALVDA